MLTLCWKHGRLHSPLGGSSKFDGGRGTWINTLGELEGASKKRENILLISVLSCVSWKSYFSVKLKTLSTKIKVSYNYIPTTNYILPWVSTNLNQYFLKKNEKNSRRYHHFTQLYQKQDHMLHCFWDLVCGGLIAIFHFGLFFVLLFPNSPKNQK